MVEEFIERLFWVIGLGLGLVKESIKEEEVIKSLKYGNWSRG